MKKADLFSIISHVLAVIFAILFLFPVAKWGLESLQLLVRKPSRWFFGIKTVEFISAHEALLYFVATLYLGVYLLTLFCVKGAQKSTAFDEQKEKDKRIIEDMRKQFENEREIIELSAFERGKAEGQSEMKNKIKRSAPRDQKGKEIW